jgi:hypothetical protein
MQDAAAPRSLFVTNLAWISIALAGAHALMSLLQNVAYAVLPLPMLPPESGGLFPPLVVWMFAHLRLLMLASLLFGVLWLWASIDLMRRRAWARIAFIGLCVFGIVATIGATLWQLYLFHSIAELLAPHDDAPGLMAKGMMASVPIVVAVVAVVLSWLLGWIAWKLLQPGIALEFRRPGTH